MISDPLVALRYVAIITVQLCKTRGSFRMWCGYRNRSVSSRSRRVPGESRGVPVALSRADDKECPVGCRRLF